MSIITYKKELKISITLMETKVWLEYFVNTKLSMEF